MQPIMTIGKYWRARRYFVERMLLENAPLRYLELEKAGTLHEFIKGIEQAMMVNYKERYLQMLEDTFSEAKPRETLALEREIMARERNSDKMVHF